MKTLEVLVAIVVVAMVALAFVAGESNSRMVTTTATITSASSNASGLAIKEVVVQPEILNLVCILQRTNQTTTFLLRAGSGNQVTTTITTESLTALSTVTIYRNATILYSGMTCTEVNPHYNATQTTMSCPPCA